MIVYRYRGIMTLTLLMLLSVMLLIFMLFDDDAIRLHSSLASLRQIYVSHNIELQQISQQQKRTACSEVPLNSTATVTRVAFEQAGFSDSNRHYIWCRRSALFKQSPKKGINEGRFSEMINEESVSLFQGKFGLPNDLVQEQSDYLYWLDKNQTEWTIAGDIYGIIVAEGNLHIAGKGRIRGAVISGGAISTDEKVSIAYRKATVTNLVQLYSQWQRAEKTWHDFTP
ncbi:conserved hypothetical protein [Actinobacillus succinogenes 130Z]|uniref:DUF2572 family protein n=2 Tax=Actinobacillus succinogenes TaxID=67854 RepID=A6VQ92_ACTSZ|nr:conserved hypothetical protein [Actinobacillus succinogenes 130Z]